MEYNTELNEKLKETVLGAKIMKCTEKNVRFLNELTNLCNEAIEKLENDSPISNIFDKPEEVEECKEMMNNLITCCEIKDVMGLINKQNTEG